MVVFESVITFLKVNFLLKNHIHAEKYLNHKYMNTLMYPDDETTFQVPEITSSNTCNSSQS